MHSLWLKMETLATGLNDVHLDYPMIGKAFIKKSEGIA